MNNMERNYTGLHKIWWVPLITGLIAIGLGVWCFCSPETSLAVFAYVFAGALIFAGILNFCYSISNRRLHTNWGWSLVLGLLEVICGAWLFAMPAETLAVSFAYAAGIWLLVVAINSLGEVSYFSRNNVAWTIWMVLLLIASIVFVIYFLFNPLFGGLVGWMWIGFSLLFFGVWRIALALKLRTFIK